MRRGGIFAIKGSARIKGCFCCYVLGRYGSSLFVFVSLLLVFSTQLNLSSSSCLRRASTRDSLLESVQSASLDGVGCVCTRVSFELQIFADMFDWEGIFSRVLVLPRWNPRKLLSLALYHLLQSISSKWGGFLWNPWSIVSINPSNNIKCEQNSKSTS